LCDSGFWILAGAIIDPPLSLLRPPDLDLPSTLGPCQKKKTPHTLATLGNLGNLGPSFVSRRVLSPTLFFFFSSFSLFYQQFHKNEPSVFFFAHVVLTLSRLSFLSATCLSVLFCLSVCVCVCCVHITCLSMFYCLGWPRVRTVYLVLSAFPCLCRVCTLSVCTLSITICSIYKLYDERMNERTNEPM
jgi:hypothetical protein